MAIPIWKDKIIDLLSASVQFRIYDWDNNVSLYDGVANARPGEATAKVRVNDICADYLENVLPTFGNLDVTGLVMKRFGVQVRLPGQTWTPLVDVTFYNDWSYDYDFDPSTTHGLSCPINGHIDSRMPIPYTAYDRAQVTATLVRKNGTSQSVVIPITGGGGGLSGDFSSDFSSDFLIGGGDGNNGFGTCVIRADSYANLDRVIIAGMTYKVVTGCAKYALYYVNAFGGWDCFLIEGNTLEADTLKRFTREVVYDNRVISNRGIHNYVNEVTKGFTFQSGWLLADQGERMHHLINSTFVYLYDIANDDMIPVTIPTTSCEYKTYKNQGNKLVNYTIQVEVAQNRVRR